MEAVVVDVADFQSEAMEYLTDVVFNEVASRFTLDEVKLLNRLEIKPQISSSESVTYFE